MEKTLMEAVKANNIAQIREALTDIIIKDSGKTVPLETVTEVIEMTPGLFDEDDGTTYAASPAEMTDEMTSRLQRDLKKNFSIDKFRLLTEVYALKAQNPKSYKNTGIVEDASVTEEERARMVEDAAAAFGADTPRKNASGRKVGIAIMILGCAAAIVGLCVPVKFLLGLGIGIFMLGTALTYINIRNDEPSEVETVE